MHGFDLVLRHLGAEPDPAPPARPSLAALWKGLPRLPIHAPGLALQPCRLDGGRPPRPSEEAAG